MSETLTPERLAEQSMSETLSPKHLAEMLQDSHSWPEAWHTARVLTNDDVLFLLRSIKEAREQVAAAEASLQQAREETQTARDRYEFAESQLKKANELLDVYAAETQTAEASLQQAREALRLLWNDIGENGQNQTDAKIHNLIAAALSEKETQANG